MLALDALPSTSGSTASTISIHARLGLQPPQLRETTGGWCRQRFPHPVDRRKLTRAPLDINTRSRRLINPPAAVRSVPINVAAVAALKPVSHSVRQLPPRGRGRPAHLLAGGREAGRNHIRRTCNVLAVHFGRTGSCHHDASGRAHCRTALSHSVGADVTPNSAPRYDRDTRKRRASDGGEQERQNEPRTTQSRSLHATWGVTVREQRGALSPKASRSALGRRPRSLHHIISMCCIEEPSPAF